MVIFKYNIHFKAFVCPWENMTCCRWPNIHISLTQRHYLYNIIDINNKSMTFSKTDKRNLQLKTKRCTCPSQLIWRQRHRQNISMRNAKQDGPKRTKTHIGTDDYVMTDFERPLEELLYVCDDNCHYNYRSTHHLIESLISHLLIPFCNINGIS